MLVTCCGGGFVSEEEVLYSFMIETPAFSGLLSLALILASVFSSFLLRCLGRLERDSSKVRALHPGGTRFPDSRPL